MKTICCERCGIGNQQKLSMFEGMILCKVCENVTKECSPSTGKVTK